MRAPRPGAGGELASHTQVYVDVYIAIECLHMRYPEYIRQTTQAERELYALYFSLKNLKEEEAMRRSQEQAEMERSVARGLPDRYRP